MYGAAHSMLLAPPAMLDGIETLKRKDAGHWAGLPTMSSSPCRNVSRPMRRPLRNVPLTDSQSTIITASSALTITACLLDTMFGTSVLSNVKLEDLGFRPMTKSPILGTCTTSPVSRKRWTKQPQGWQFMRSLFFGRPPMSTHDREGPRQGPDDEAADSARWLASPASSTGASPGAAWPRTAATGAGRSMPGNNNSPPMSCVESKRHVAADAGTSPGGKPAGGTDGAAAHAATASSGRCGCKAGPLDAAAGAEPTARVAAATIAFGAGMNSTLGAGAGDGCNASGAGGGPRDGRVRTLAARTVP
mmetsp:Transcript_40651/g.117573  ORF Transcript_40651/g.117573 Transcript_40651/m.117573 type:complete len:304 (+) Transcript_40651:93-1004(+)